MELKKLRCSNCDGALKQAEDGKYYCENCGTSYLLDRDPEDVFYEKFDKLTSNENITQTAQSVREASSKMFLLVVSIFVLIMIVAMIFISSAIKKENLRRIEAERSEAVVSSEIAERESEFYEEYDRISQRIDEQVENT